MPAPVKMGSMGRPREKLRGGRGASRTLNWTGPFVPDTSYGVLDHSSVSREKCEWCLQRIILREEESLREARIKVRAQIPPGPGRKT